MAKVRDCRSEGSGSLELDHETLRAAIQRYLQARACGEPATQVVEAAFGLARADFRPYADHLSEFLKGTGEPPQPRLEPGTTLGKYRIVDLLGGGAHGNVYSAIDQALGSRHVAVKVCPTESDEADILARLRHAHLPTLIDHFHDADRGLHVHVIDFRGSQSAPAYLAMLDPSSRHREAVRIVAEIASAVEYLHSKGIIHCDIKPANIVVDSRGVPTLVDFNSARHLLTAAPPAVTMEFTPPHLLEMSPHLFISEITTGFDVFSLAVTLLHLVASDDVPDSVTGVLDSSLESDEPLSRQLAGTVATLLSRARNGSDVSRLLPVLQSELNAEWKRSRPYRKRLRAPFLGLTSFSLIGLFVLACAAYVSVVPNGRATSHVSATFLHQARPAPVRREAAAQPPRQPATRADHAESAVMKRAQSLVRDRRLHEAVQAIDQALATTPDAFRLIRSRCGIELALISVEGGTPRLDHFERMLAVGGDALTGHNVFDAGMAYAIAASDAPDGTERDRLIARSRALFIEARRVGIDPDFPKRRRGLRAALEAFPDVLAIALGDDADVRGRR